MNHDRYRTHPVHGIYGRFHPDRLRPAFGNVFVFPAEEKGADKVDEVVDAAADKVEEASDKAEEVVDAAADKAEEVVDAAADKAEEAADAAADKAEEVSTEAKEIILEGPSVDMLSEVFETGTVEDSYIKASKDE